MLQKSAGSRDYSRQQVDAEYASLLAEVDTASPPMSAADRLRQNLFRTTIDHAIRYSPFYTKQLSGVDPEILTLKDLRKLPLLYKSDLTEQFDRIVTFKRFADHLMYTSGTTGEPLEVPVYQEEVDTYENLVLSVWKKYIGEDQPLTLTIIRIGHGTHIFSGRIPALPCHIQFGLGQLCEMLRKEHRVNGRRMRPTVIDSNVLCLRQITKELILSGINPKSFNVELLIISGWYMTDWERRFYENAWGAPIVERYGVTEVHGDGKRYPGAAYYTFDFTVIPEVIDPETEDPIDEGIGLMVLTGLYPFNQAVPKIRYVVGDLVEVTRTNFLGGEIGIRFLSRQGDCITAPPGSSSRYRFFSCDVAEALAPLPDVARKTNTGFLKFRLSEPAPHKAMITVELSYPPSLFPTRADEIKAHILNVIARRSLVDGETEVVLKSPGEIDNITKL